MEVGTLNAQFRPHSGTSAVRKLRQRGHIPAICYGGGQDPVQLQIDPIELQKALDPIKGRNTLLRLRIAGLGQSPVETAVMVRDAQRSKLRGDLLHVDFLRVATDKPVRAVVPIALTGKAVGVKEGGTLHQVYRTLTVSCVPEKIPAKIEIDVSNLAIGQSIHVSELTLQDGITTALSPTATLCVVTAPKAERPAEQAEGAPAAEGAEAATEAKGGEKGAPSAKTPAPAKAAGEKAAAKK